MALFSQDRIVALGPKHCPRTFFLVAWRFLVTLFSRDKIVVLGLKYCPRITGSSPRTLNASPRPERWSWDPTRVSQDIELLSHLFKSYG